MPLFLGCMFPGFYSFQVLGVAPDDVCRRCIKACRVAGVECMPSDHDGKLAIRTDLFGVTLTIGVSAAEPGTVVNGRRDTVRARVDACTVPGSEDDGIVCVYRVAVSAS